MTNWRNLPRDHEKIVYKKDPSSTTTYGWTVVPSRTETVMNEVNSHRNWVIIKIIPITKKGY